LGDQLRDAAALTPLLWLVGPVERVIAIVCHAACRGLVLVGAHERRGGMIALGLSIFALLDGIAGAGQVSGLLGAASMW
jgi:hypothetical protein